LEAPVSARIDLQKLDREKHKLQGLFRENRIFEEVVNGAIIGQKLKSRLRMPVDRGSSPKNKSVDILPRYMNDRPEFRFHSGYKKESMLVPKNVFPLIKPIIESSRKSAKSIGLSNYNNRHDKMDASELSMTFAPS